MTTDDRRRQGRAIRRARRRYGPTASVAFVSIAPDLSGFIRAMEGVARAISARSHTYQHPHQIIHNGKKPR